MLQIECANDLLYRTGRCRTLPVVATVTSVPNYPTSLKIYLTTASRYWQVQCFINSSIIRRSLRTTSKRDALRLAREFYINELVLRGVRFEALQIGRERTHSISTAATLLLQQEKARADRDEVAQHSYTMLGSRLQKHVIPFFKSTPVEHIHYAQVESFLNFLSAQHYKPITLSQYLTALRKVLNLAHANRWIEQVPQFPKIKLNSTARGSFTVREYHAIVRCARRLSNLPETAKKKTHRNTRDGIYTATTTVPLEFVWLIGFMVNSFVRPVDIKVIQHQHVEIVRGEHTYLRLTLPETKRHTAQIITMPAAVRIYIKLKAHFAAQGLAGENDYLFLPAITDRLAAITLIDGYFRKIVIELGLRYGTQGQRRTLYSLRHCAITFRLLYGQGIDLLTLARNARTSLEMVDKFYASELTAEMNVGMLHSRR